MSTRAKIAIIVVMVAIVIGLIIWDKSSKTNETKTAREETVIPPTTPPQVPPEQVTPQAPIDRFETPKESVPKDLPQTPPTEKPFENVIPKPEKIAPPLPPEESPIKSKEYVIQKGDNFKSISRQFYGSEKYWKLIADANPKIKPTNMVGKKVIIPPSPISKPEKVTPPLPEEKPFETTESKEYVIQKGDTYELIARHFYGSTKHWKVIADANPDVNPTKMKVGKKITIPPNPSDEVTKPPKVDKVKSKTKEPIEPKETEKHPLSEEGTYTIKKGDSLWTIAQNAYGNGGKWKKILEANLDKIPSEDAMLKVGMVLTIPKE